MPNSETVCVTVLHDGSLLITAPPDVSVRRLKNGTVMLKAKSKRKKKRRP